MGHRPGRFFVARPAAGYDFAMALRRPLIESAPLRTLVIGLVMWVLVAASVGLAFAVTQAPLRSSHPVQQQEAHFGQLALSLPAAWTGESVTNPQPGVTQWSMVNRHALGEQLRVVRVVADDAQAGAVLAGLVIAPLRAEHRVFIVGQGQNAMLQRYTDDQLPPGAIDLTFSTRRLASDLPFSLQRLASAGTSPQVHSVRLFKLSEQETWVFHLSEQVASETWNREMELAQLKQLRLLLEGLSAVDPSA